MSAQVEEPRPRDLGGGDERRRPRAAHAAAVASASAMSSGDRRSGRASFIARLVATSPNAGLAGRSISTIGTAASPSTSGRAPEATAACHAPSTAARTRERIASGAATGSVVVVNAEAPRETLDRPGMVPPGCGDTTAGRAPCGEFHLGPPGMPGSPIGHHARYRWVVHPGGTSGSRGGGPSARPQPCPTATGRARGRGRKLPGGLGDPLHRIRRPTYCILADKRAERAMQRPLVLVPWAVRRGVEPPGIGAPGERRPSPPQGPRDPDGTHTPECVPSAHS